MSSENSPPPTPSSPTRRASFTPGQKLADLFGRSPGANGPAAAPSAYPGPIAAAAANAQAHQRRRISISTLGLSGSSAQTTPFTPLRNRQESFSSSSSGPADANDSAIDDGDAPAGTPNTPFARRMSFGARAIRDVRGGAGSFNGDGFNWSDQLRSRAQRSASLTSPVAAPPVAAQEAARAASIAAAAAPAKPPPRVSKAPDHFQERILKGDFLMD